MHSKHESLRASSTIFQSHLKIFKKIIKKSRCPYINYNIEPWLLISINKKSTKCLRQKNISTHLYSFFDQKYFNYFYNITRTQSKIKMFFSTVMSFLRRLLSCGKSNIFYLLRMASGSWRLAIKSGIEGYNTTLCTVQSVH